MPEAQVQLKQQRAHADIRRIRSLVLQRQALPFVTDLSWMGNRIATTEPWDARDLPLKVMTNTGLYQALKSGEQGSRSTGQVITISICSRVFEVHGLPRPVIDSQCKCSAEKEMASSWGI